jgi:hypothetical protein
MPPDTDFSGDAAMSRPPTDATSRSGARYVVTLNTSSVPMPVTLASGLAFPGLAVFRSRTVEDGRERFRLHLGYFGSMPEAEAALAEVRSRYPTALVATVPVAGGGSLDDTLNTAFTLVRGAVAQAVEAERAAPPPPTASEPQDPRATSRAPTLTPGEVASVMAPQRYAVQLDWALRPIDPAAVPRLGIFRAYSLYAVSVLRQGCAEYGLRLGFFKNLDGARQVADYVRHEFRQASVVPVSYREYERASELTRPGRGAATDGGGDAPAPAARPSPEAGAAAPHTRDQLLPLLGAHELEGDRDQDGRVTLTAEERAMLTRQPQRGLRRW